MNYDSNEYTRIAYYYYKRGMTQDEIAQKLNMSRPRVNRILNRCRELGIVKITIHGISEEYYDLERNLEKLYQLRDVRIVETNEEDLYNALGILSGDYLTEVIKDGDIIGFSRGQAVSALVNHMQPINQSNLTVTQLLGGWNYDNTQTNVDDIVHRFSTKIKAKARYLYAPVLVHSSKLKEALIEEPFFIEAYNIIKSCNIAAVGIGNVKDKPYFMNTSMIDENDYCNLQKNNIVGEICSHYFDENGKSILSSLNDKVISVVLNDYMNIPLRIGIAGGEGKLHAILGAVRGRYINSLITDLKTAQALEQIANNVHAKK
jgi:DNA-binding transcriptional regulator LsrR (DeoR family)